MICLSEKISNSLRWGIRRSHWRYQHHQWPKAKHDEQNAYHQQELARAGTYKIRCGHAQQYGLPAGTLGCCSQFRWGCIEAYCWTAYEAVAIELAACWRHHSMCSYWARKSSTVSVSNLSWSQTTLLNRLETILRRWASRRCVDAQRWNEIDSKRRRIDF